jgi:hypothetical protein
MLAMALLLHGGLLGGMGVEAVGVDGSGMGAWTLRSRRGPGPHHAPPLVEQGLEPPTRAPHT